MSQDFLKKITIDRLVLFLLILGFAYHQYLWSGSGQVFVPETVQKNENYTAPLQGVTSFSAVIEAITPTSMVVTASLPFDFREAAERNISPLDLESGKISLPPFSKRLKLIITPQTVLPPKEITTLRVGSQIGVESLESLYDSDVLTARNILIVKE